MFAGFTIFTPHALQRLGATALVILVLALSGCAVEPKQISLQAKEEIEKLVAPIEKPSLPEEKPEPVTINGEVPRPVTIENKAYTPEPLAASLASDTDIVALDAKYSATVSKKKAGFFEKLPWGIKSKVVITCLIPKTLPNKQEVLSTNFSMEPERVYEVGDNRYAEFVVEKPKQDFDIHIITTLKLFRYDLSTALNAKNPGAAPDPAKYLREERYVEVNNQAIKQTAQQLQGSYEVDTVKKIYDFVLQKLTYDDAKASSGDLTPVGAAKAIHLDRGICVEYSDLFIALCRAKGIPARSVGGIPTEGNNATKGHAWAEVYFKNYGWVPFDPTWGDTNATSFNRLRPTYIYLTNVRNDEVINNSDIFGYKYVGTPVTVEYSTTIDSARKKHFDNALASINGKKAELSQLKSQLDASFAGIEALKAELEQLKSEIAQLKSNLEAASASGSQDISSLVERHNSLITTYNEKVSTYNQKVSSYETLRKDYGARQADTNALVQQYNEQK